MMIFNAIGKNLKIDPYEPCPCGTDKKFKFCCYQKARSFKQETLRSYSEYSDKRLHHEFTKLWESTDFKKCFGFDSENCNGIIKSAHSIQNNRILNRISENGHVYTISHKITKEGIKPEFKKVSKNQASTFFGFCDYHDTELFKPIELHDYKNDPLQNYLFAFRAFAIEYHKKIRKLENYRNTFKLNPAALLDEGAVYSYRIAQLDIEDDKIEYQKFQRAHTESNFGNIITISRQLNYEVKFAASSSFAVKDDLNGKMINDIYSEKAEEMPSIYINVYPIESGTNIILSYQKDDDYIYSEYFKQINTLSDMELVEHINFLLIEYTENIFFSPKFVSNMSEAEKESLFRSFQSSIFILEKFFLTEEDKYFKFNLFS